MTGSLKNKCPCCSGKSYANCCKLFHKGKHAENALQLMRSRFTAYALDLPEYIIQTTHPANPQFIEDTFLWKKSISQFSKSSWFKKLDILDFKEERSNATVTFVAHIYQGADDCTFTEKSYFELIDHDWLYRSGQVVKGLINRIYMDNCS